MSEATVLGKDRVVEAVAKLIELTQNGGLSWLALRPSDIALDGMEYERIEAAYHTRFSGKRLRVYRRSFKVIRSRGGTIMHLPQNAYEPVRVEEVTLEYLDELGNVVWTFPALDSLNNLLSAVQYQAGGKDLINDLLSSS